MKWLLDLLKGCFKVKFDTKNKNKLTAVSLKPQSERPSVLGVDWSDRKSKISKYFTVHEATYLPSWGTWHPPTEAEKRNILLTAKRMDVMREALGKPIKVHVWIRPKKYNKSIGGASRSAHISGKAVDWSVGGMRVNTVMDRIQPKCGTFRVALENNGSKARIKKNAGKGGPRNWVHAQTRPMTKGVKWRIFNP